MALLPQIQYSNPLEDGVNLYNAGLKLGTQQREQNALRDVGQLLAAGNQKGARNALYGAGMVDQGLKLDDRMTAASDKAQARALAAQERKTALALKAQGMLANVAYLADTPEKFEAGKAMLAKAGLDVSGYDFSQREALLAQAIDAKTRMEIAAKGNKPDLIHAGKNLYNPRTGEWITPPNTIGEDGVPPDAGELEKGLRWRKENGKIALDESGRPIAEPIPGSPKEAVAAETAARIGLGEKFSADVPAIRQEIQSGALNGADYYLKRGKAGDVLRRIEDGQEALVRNLTGAGMSQAEAESYASRFAPGNFDTEETILGKLDNLEKNLKSVQQRVMIGRGTARTDTPKAEQPKVSAKPEGMSDAQIVAEARKAVAAGKDKEEIRKRLDAWGIKF